MAYRYANLTGALRDTDSPLRKYFGEQFPNVAPLQRTYRQAGGELLVEPGTANPAIVGAAFDFGVRFTLLPNDFPAVAAAAFIRRPTEFRAIGDLAMVAGRAAADGDHATLGRACWALGWTTDVYRSGRVIPASPLRRLLAEPSGLTVAGMLRIAPADGLHQLTEMWSLAEDRLVPAVSGPYLPGPTFDGSEYCAADADLIAGDLLIDLKTRVGTKNQRTGVRSDSLPTVDIYQLLGYTMLDHSDSYRIREVGIYSGRYGQLHTWALADFLRILAGAEVDLREVRERVWALLTRR